MDITTAVEQALTIVGVDLAKRRIELAIQEPARRTLSSKRLSPEAFRVFFANRSRCHIVMEACGTAQHWARVLSAQGHQVSLLPAQHVRAYVRRNKTDAADAAALIEASRCGGIRPVPIKTVDQQLVLQLHRVREQLKATRVARINGLRGMLREFGFSIAQGATQGLRQVHEALEDAENGLPDALRPAIGELLEEIAALQRRMDDLERQLRQLADEDLVVARLTSIPGIGPLGASALRAVVGQIERFRSGRHLASYLGLTAREHSSGELRRLGRITKQGDVYLRTLLVHGARAVLAAAVCTERRGRPLDRLRAWALTTARRVGYNKATVALANKLARIAWATWTRGEPYRAGSAPAAAAAA
jgi:transposase